MNESTTALELFQRIFEIVFPIVAIVCAGYLYGRKHSPDLQVANRVNMDIFLPALVFSVMAGKSFDLYAHIDLAIATLIVVLGAGLVAIPIALAFGLKIKTFIPPMMFNNCGNLGLPLALLAFGDSGLAAAVIMFLVSNLMHFSLGTHIVDQNARLIMLIKNPIIVATIAGLTLTLTGLSLPQWFAVPIDMLGQVSIPLMLFALGVRMITVDLSNWRVGLLGAVVSPLSSLIIALPVAWIAGLSDDDSAYLVMCSVLPPAVLNFMFSERYNQDPETVASIVLIGNIFSLVIIPTTLWFII